MVASIDSCMNIRQKKTQQNGYECNGVISINYSQKYRREEQPQITGMLSNIASLITFSRPKYFRISLHKVI